MTTAGWKRLKEMLASPPKVLTEGSRNDEYVEDRPYDLDPQAFARLESSFKLASHYDYVGFAELTAELMSGDRIDDFIEKAEEHDSVCQEGKDATLANIPTLRTNSPEARRKLLECILDFTQTITTSAGNNKIPISVYMREEPNPTRAPLEPGSVLSEGCATLGEEYYKFCPHHRAGLAGKRLFCKVMKMSLANFPSLLDLCEKAP